MKILIIPIIIFLLFLVACDKHNNPPTLSEISVPDSLAKGDTLLYLVSALAIDPDGAGDIDSVYFIVTRPDSTSNGIHFAMNDRGELGDSVPGNNRYSTGIQAPAPQSQSGNYTFTFYARDKHGNNSNNPSAIITAY